jgi:hypothetical protein
LGVWRTRPRIGRCCVPIGRLSVRLPPVRGEGPAVVTLTANPLRQLGRPAPTLKGRECRRECSGVHHLRHCDQRYGRLGGTATRNAGNFRTCPKVDVARVELIAGLDAVRRVADRRPQPLGAGARPISARMFKHPVAGSGRRPDLPSESFVSGWRRENGAPTARPRAGHYQVLVRRGRALLKKAVHA